MHQTNRYEILPDEVIDGLMVNRSANGAILLAGLLNITGYCNGVIYSDRFESWNDVIVEAKYKIASKEYYTVTKQKEDVVILQSGVRAKLSTGRAIEVDGANIYWSPSPFEECKFDDYGILHGGRVQKIFDDSTKNHEIQEVYSSTSGEMTFALAKKSTMKVCGHILIKTEYPKLYILEVKPSEDS